MQLAFNAVMSANPVALIILGIVAAVAAAIIIWAGVPFTWLVALAGSKAEAGRWIPKASWPWVGAAACCQTLAVPSFVSAVHFTYAVNASSITAIQPLLALIVAHIFVREAENITWRLVGGAGMVGLVAYVIYRRPGGGSKI